MKLFFYFDFLSLEENNKIKKKNEIKTIKKRKIPSIFTKIKFFKMKKKIIYF